MINIFKKNKWQIIYIEEAGAPKKGVIVTAKTMSQAKENFSQIINGKKVIVVAISMIA